MVGFERTTNETGEIPDCLKKKNGIKQLVVSDYDFTPWNNCRISDPTLEEPHFGCFVGLDNSDGNGTNEVVFSLVVV